MGLCERGGGLGGLKQNLEKPSNPGLRVHMWDMNLNDSSVVLCCGVLQCTAACYSVLRDMTRS